MWRKAVSGVLISCCLVGSVRADLTPREVKVGGRIMYDVSRFESDDVDLNNGGELRYARLYAKGKLDEAWFFKLQYDFTYSGIEGIRDAYLGYAQVPYLDSIRIGNFPEYGSLEDTTSSKNTLFMSRAMHVEAFIPAARRLGIGADAHGESWYAGAGLFGEGAEVDSSEEDGTGVSGRFVWIPEHSDRSTLHLGLFAQARTPRGDNTVRYRNRPEAHLSTERFLDTGVISNVNHMVMCGLEAAWIVGRGSLQGEYLANAVARDGFSTENYSGAYLSASWFLTGDSLAYDADCGCLGRVEPRTPLGDGGFGAVAIACRFSFLDLNDSIQGGREENITVGVNWHPTSSVRFMLNYVNAQASARGVDVEAHAIQARAQVVF